MHRSNHHPSDYGEFKTKHMNLSPSEDPRTGRHRRDTVDPTVSALREELYAMRDEVQQILDLLVTIHGVELLSPIAADAQAIIPRLSSLMEAIVLILTNNYSEWLESDLSTRRKILPYPAFRSLSPGVLQDVNEHLKQIREELDVEGGGDFRRTATSQMIYNHQITLLTVGGQMEEIQSTVSFLESLLVPSPSMSTFGERPDTCDALAPQVAVNL